MPLDDRTKALIAVGASITANCQSCLHSTVCIALETGVDAQDIAEAIEVAKLVRRCATTSMEKFLTGLRQEVPVAANSSATECGCQ